MRELKNLQIQKEASRPKLKKPLKVRNLENFSSVSSPRSLLLIRFLCFSYQISDPKSLINDSDSVTEEMSPTKSVESSIFSSISLDREAGSEVKPGIKYRAIYSLSIFEISVV